jgi:hypothetical protein
MAPHLGLQRIMIPSAQVSSLTTGSITLPSAKGTFVPPGDYFSLDSYNLTTTTTSVTFSSISQDYTHLEVRLYTKTAGGTSLSDIRARFNGDTNTNYSWHKLYNSESGDAAVTGAGGANYMFAGVTNETVSGAFNTTSILIPDYKNTSKFTTIRTRSGGTQGTGGTNYTQWGGGTWRNTAAVTSLTIYEANGNGFVAGSAFHLYGIKIVGA